MFIRITCFFLLLCSLKSSGQNQSVPAASYIFFDAIIGVENTDLHYGKVYQEQHRNKSKKTKFFPVTGFNLGAVVFNDLPYFNVPLKYNVYDDELLMQVDKKWGGDVLQLYKNQVYSFKIDGHSFIRINASNLKKGFYEVALKKQNISLYIKHKKSIKQRLDSKLVFYEFDDQERQYFLFYKNTYYVLEKVSDLFAIFSKYETEIKHFEKEQDSKILFETRIKNVLEYLDTLLFNEYDKMKPN